MYNSNPGGSANANIFNNNTTQSMGKILLKLRILAGCIACLAIIKVVIGDYNGFNSDLMTSLFIFLTTFCINPFLAGFLVISLLFSAIITGVFFLLQIQNYCLSIENPLKKSLLTTLYIINSLGLFLYSFSIYYCYKFYSNSQAFSSGYSLLNDNPSIQRGTYGSFENNERFSSNAAPTTSTFKPFAGSGTRLDA